MRNYLMSLVVTMALFSSAILPTSYADRYRSDVTGGQGSLGTVVQQMTPQCFDPVPNPTAAGWTVEENGGSDIQEGTPLKIVDPGATGGVFANVRVADDAIFQQEISLTPRFTIQQGYGKNLSDESIGVHVTINDGTKMIRAVILENGAIGRFKVALVSPLVQSGYSNGFWFNGSTAEFTLKRLADGTSVLQVPNPVMGEPPLTELQPLVQQPDSERPNTKTLEFGTLNVAARTTTNWDTLGLPRLHCSDPVPNPTAAGWTVEKNGISDVHAGTPLKVIDGSAAAGNFVNVRVADDAIFQQEISLTPRFGIDGGYGKDDSDQSLGIQVTINDGTKMVRAVILEDGQANKFKVALVSPLVQSGYSTGFSLTGSIADFTLKRLADGTGVLQVPNPVAGEPPLTELQPLAQQPDSERPNTKTLEFGTLNAPNRTTTNWATLGLPCNPSEFPLGLTVRQVRINDANNDRLRFRGNFTLASGQTIDPTAEQVTLKFSNTAGIYYSAGGHTGLPPGSFENRANANRPRWSLTEAARNTFGIERFDIFQDDLSIFFIDRRTNVSTGNFTNTTIEFAVGNDRGIANVTLEERPPGSGRWRLDR